LCLALTSINDRMSVMTLRAIQALSAGLCITMGLVVLAGWAFEIEVLKTVLPGLASMKAKTALGFVFAGVALALLGRSSPHARRLSSIAAALVLALGIATAIEYLMDVNFGIDQVIVRNSNTPPDHYPGRMALATSLGFVLAAAALLLSRNAADSLPRSRLARALVYGTAGLGGLGVGGYAFDVELLYSISGFDTMALLAATGFLVLAAGLVAAGRAGLWLNVPLAEDARIIRLATRLLMLTAAVTGIAVFAIMASAVMRTLERGLRDANEARIDYITAEIDLRGRYAEDFTTHPAFLKELRLFQDDPGNSDLRGEVIGDLDKFWSHGFNVISVINRSGREIAHVEQDIGIAPALEVRLAGARESWLLWRDKGFYLRNRLPLADDKGPLGSMVTEQFLPKLTQVMFETPLFWKSGELLLCQPRPQVIDCFPRRPDATPSIESNAGQGEQAILQQALYAGPGFSGYVDGDGRRILGVAVPVNNLGLVSVLQVDVAEIYQPVVRQFLWALVLVMTLVTLGVVLLRRRLQPLAARLVRAEAQSREHYEALQTSTALMHSLFADNPDAILVVDDSGRIVEANPRTETLFGYSRAVLLTRPVEILLPERHRAAHVARRAAYNVQPRLRAMGSNLLLYGRRADGGEFPVDVTLSPMRGSGEARTIATVRDITERRRAEAENAEKTILLQEIHHRVKNNLQVIASLLSLQAGATEAPETRAALVEIQGRVKSMALLHQLLYENQSFAHVDLGDYLRELARHAITSTEVTNVNVEFDLTPLKLDLHRAVPCGLLVNELLTNACKHAFPDGRAGTVRLELHVPGESDMALLVISDDGVGLPEGFALGQSTSLGLQLVPLLAEQFGGELLVKQGVGTRYELRFWFAT
jgi:PAS domain S-box-containing protein